MAVYLVHGGAPEDRTYYSSDTRIDSIAYGCLLALSFIALIPAPREKMSFLHLALLLVGLGGVLFSLLYRDPEFRETTRYSLQGAALLPHNSDEPFVLTTTRCLNTSTRHG